MNDYWTLTNISYQQWKEIVRNAQRWPNQPMFQVQACWAQAAYVMYSALEQWEINQRQKERQSDDQRNQG